MRWTLTDFTIDFSLHQSPIRQALMWIRVSRRFVKSHNPPHISMDSAGKQWTRLD